MGTAELERGTHVGATRCPTGIRDVDQIPACSLPQGGPARVWGKTVRAVERVLGGMQRGDPGVFTCFGEGREALTHSASMSRPLRDHRHTAGPRLVCRNLQRLPVAIPASLDETSGLNCHITTPLNLDPFIELGRSMDDFWPRIAKLPPDGSQ